MSNQNKKPMDLTQIEARAGHMYNVYCAAVGGKDASGAPLPDWAAFRADPANLPQVNAWLAVAQVKL